MPGCVMAVDGWVLWTRKPYKKEALLISSYMNRKGHYGLVCMAGCEASTKFNMFSAQCPGATNDSLAFQLTNVYRSISLDLLSPAFYIIGDAAFSCKGQVLSPWPGQALPVYQDSFNYHLSSMRQCIERAFGLMVARWCILKKALLVRFDRWALVATVCVKLHNYCVDERELLNFMEDENNDDPDLNLFDDGKKYDLSHRQTFDYRTFTNLLREGGFKGPG